jgi:hypothetical protein
MAITQMWIIGGPDLPRRLSRRVGQNDRSAAAGPAGPLSTGSAVFRHFFGTQLDGLAELDGD